MAIGTYAELQTALQNWLARADADIVSRIPEFITLAEAQFNRDIKHRDMEVQTTLVTVAGTETVALPSDYIEARATVLETTPKVTQTLITPQQLATNWANGVSARPQEYTIIGANLHFGPIPDDAYNITFTYYQKIAFLSDANTTNWMLTDNPDLYVYGALMQASPYLLNDERVVIWSAFYERGIAALEKSQNRSTYNGGPLAARVDVYTG